MIVKDIKPNSHKAKAEEAKKNTAIEQKRTKKVVSGTVKTKKKGELRKATENFISEEASNIKDYVVKDVLVPTVKNTIWEAITSTLDMILFGGTGKAKTGGTQRNLYSYSSQYRTSSTRSNDNYVKARSRFDMDDIIFESRGEAERVIDEMFAVLDEYKIVRVADLYDMAGLSQPYTSNKYGWTNLRNAKVVRVRNGYTIELPRAVPIE